MNAISKMGETVTLFQDWTSGLSEPQYMGMVNVGEKVARWSASHYNLAFGKLFIISCKSSAWLTREIQNN